VIIELAGMIRRGKYTFVINCVFPIKLLLVAVMELEKNCHGNIPAYTNTAYGALLLLGKLAILPKIMVKTTIVKNG